MSKSYSTLALFLILGVTQASAQFLDVVSGELPPYNVPVNLVRDHFTGQGIEILDVQFDGNPQAVGYFTGGESTIGLHRGLIMSTGRAASSGINYGAEAVGTIFASTVNGVTLNDPILAAQSTGPLNDLVRYQITFRASGDSVRFRYVFASEEYPEYSCTTFNDIFGFYLQGPGYPIPVNIARVPGTNLPVAINNVHPFNSQNVPTPDPCPPFNVQYYNDNGNTQDQPVYDGYLDVFTAEAAVVPCGVYVITLALADVSDSAYDSAVFLEANSLVGSTDISASFDPGDAILPENADADTVFLTFSDIPQTLLPLTLTLGGTAQNGVDYLALDTVATITTADTVLQFLIQPVPDTLNELIETVTLTVRDTGCFYRIFTLFLADQDSTFIPLDSLVFTGPVLLTAPAPTALNNLKWSVSNNVPLTIDPPLSMVYSDMTVQAGGINNFPLSTLSDISLLESVCINVAHAWVSDLNLYLFAPNGQFVELSSGNGGNGGNYTNTCFSPLATESITYGLPAAPATAAPFSGTFQPEGDWNDLLGAPLNGVWRLGIIDNNSNVQGQLLDWSLSFSGAGMGGFHYLWSTGDSLRSIVVSDSGMYAVTVSNAIATFTKTYVLYTSCNSADSLTVVLAPGESYTFGGQVLSQPGDYSLTIPAANGCDSTVYLHLELTSTAVEASADRTLYFSPNPATDETLVSWPNDASFSSIRAFDMNGRLVFSENIAGAENATLHTSGWTPGWYTVELEGSTGKRVMGRLMVKH